MESIEILRTKSLFSENDPKQNLRDHAMASEFQLRIELSC